MSIKQTPLTWREIDVITAAEKYLTQVIDLPLIDHTLPCFPNVDQSMVEKIIRVWQYSVAAFHLQYIANQKQGTPANSLLLKASRIYEQETQRILGSIFPIEHPFWKSFYQRQETEQAKPLVGIDALHFLTNCKEKIAYQLLIQSLKAILQGQYETDSNNQKEKYKHYENADRLIMDLPLDDLKNWLQNQIII